MRGFVASRAEIVFIWVAPCIPDNEEIGVSVERKKTKTQTTGTGCVVIEFSLVAA